MGIDVNADARANKVAFVSHCVLNQNAKVRGIATHPAAIRPVIDLLLANEVGIYQMPCPEMLYLGAMRWGSVKDQYNSPMFRKHLQGMAEQIADQAEDYVRNDYRVLTFIMIDGSPVCGLLKTPQPEEGQRWGGMHRYLPGSRLVQRSGVFCEILRAEMVKRGLADIPFISIPEMPDVGSLNEALKGIAAVITGEEPRIQSNT